MHTPAVIVAAGKPRKTIKNMVSNLEMMATVEELMIGKVPEKSVKIEIELMELQLKNKM